MKLTTHNSLLRNQVLQVSLEQLDNNETIKTRRCKIETSKYIKLIDGHKEYNINRQYSPQTECHNENAPNLDEDATSVVRYPYLPSPSHVRLN
jgi:hypothetical protein